MNDSAHPRVLQMMAGAERGGAEAYFVRLCLALHRAGVVQSIVTRPNAARMRALRQAGLEPVPAPFGGPFDFRTRRILGHEVARFDPDIVLTFMSRASRFTPAPGPGRRFVTIGRLGGYYDLKYFRRCRHLICNTPDLLEYVLGQGWPRERVHYVANFVEERAAAPVPRQTLDTPDKAPLVFALGRLHPNKAFDTLLRAIAGIPDAYLWLAGDGPDRAELETLAANLGIRGRVRFLGWRDDPAPFFAACDTFVIPSRHEPLGNVLLEAWMHRLPVVAAASQGPRQLIEDGVDGLLVPIDDAPALAAAIAGLIAEPKRSTALARAGRRSYERDYTEAAGVARHLALFAAVIEDEKNAQAKGK
ncbi:MAG: glycosyltransferase [Alphaproteobacteria bacterium]